MAPPCPNHSLSIGQSKVRDEQERGGPGCWRLQPLGRPCSLHCGARGLCLGAGPGAAGQRGGPGRVRPQRQAPGPGPASLPAQPGPGRRALHAHPAAGAHLLPGPGPLALPGGRLPRSRGRLLCVHLLCVHLRGRGLRGAHQRVPLRLRAPARAQGGRPPSPAARAACAAAWLAGLACAAPSLAAPHALRPGPGGASRCLERGWARAGLAYATVTFFTAAFLLVLAAYVSLARALASPSGPGPAPAGPHRRAARTRVLGLLLVFALCLAPYHLLLAPWVTGQEVAASRGGGRCRATSTLDVLHSLSLALLSLNSCLDPLIYCFSVRRFRQDCWALSCRLGVGASGAHSASLTSS
ncbi:C-X-C chemokine receptor type 3-like [Moschus berezovskii]|uniref:C-X-C chemokine receptor type 3-like n=1 Tax=Moschus berezovskii TaxID=68408 RepID=UPI002445148E|nr:C-X-C chemokine receptor type 3-like [Moschus berezovskii]